MSCDLLQNDYNIFECLNLQYNEQEMKSYMLSASTCNTMNKSLTLSSVPEI
jgi:hypothetical protein